MTPSPVKEVALRHNIAVSHDLNWVELNSHQNLLGIVVAYGRIIPGALHLPAPVIKTAGITNTAWHHSTLTIKTNGVSDATL